ncbi:MAG: hypothetical protein GF334_02060 [Candidatus Altiarchaeales archaeon]|nr:hypothetical protein [Candidatus Altiarchaeales archaeon]
MDHQMVDSTVELDAATQQTLDRLRSFKQNVTPEERKLLGIDEEALAAFSEVESPQDVRAAIQEIIDGAIKNAPAFKQLVDEDLKTEPERLPRTSRVISNLLRHLQGIVKPSAASAIRGDRQRQAQEIMLGTLRRHARTPKAAPEAPAFSKDFDPIKPNELQLFGLSADLLTPKKTRDAQGQEITTYPIANLTNTQTRDPILFFLNRLKEEKDGRNVTVKNEATKKMSDDMKKDLIYRLLRTIREYKVQEKGDIGPEAKWLGNSEKQLRQIADSLVERTPTKDPTRYQHDKFAVYEDAQALLSTVRRVKDTLTSTDIGERMEQLGDAVDTALPSPENIEDKIKEIQEEVARLGLNKDEKNAALYVNPDSLSYQPMTDLSDRKDLGKELESLQQKLREKGPTEDLINEIQNKERTYRAIGTLADKDLTRLNELSQQYMNLLTEYKDRAKENLSEKGSDVVGNMDDLVKQVAELARKFSRISKEDFFRARWNRAGGRMMREPAPEQKPEETEPGAAPKKEPQGPPELKLAADIGSYANKFQKFRGTGPAAAVEFLLEAASSGGLLDKLEEKILSFMEAKPGTKLNPSETDYSGNPLAGQGQALDEVTKSVNKMRSVVGKFKPQLLFNEAAGVLDWLADLPALVRAPKRSPKKASVFSVLRKMIPELICKLAQTDEDVEEEGAPSEEKSYMKQVPLKYRTPTAYYEMTKEEWNALPQDERKQKLEAWKKIVKKKLPDILEDIKQRAEELEKREEKKPGGRPRGPSTAPLKSPAPAGVFIYGERMTPLGKKYLKDMFVEPTFVPEFIEAMEAEGLNNMLLEGADVKKIGPDEVDSTLAKILAKGSKDLQGQTLGNILGTKAMRFAEEERQIKKTREEMEETRKRVRDRNKAIVEAEKKVLPKLIRFAEFLRRPMDKVREQLEKIQPDKRDRSPAETRMQRVLEKIENQRQKGVYTVPGKKAPSAASVKPVSISSTNVLSALSEIMSRYDLREQLSPEKGNTSDKQESSKDLNEKKAAEPITPPSKMIREILVTKKRLKDLASSVNSMEDKMKRAQQAKKFYEYALDQQRKQSEYISSVIEPQLKADMQTLDNVESFLNSEDAQKLSDEARAQAESMLNKLREGLEKEAKSLEDIVNHLQERSIASDLYTEELQTVNEDLKDGEVQRLYEVAVSPEMTHGTEEYEDVKERQRQRQKGIGYMMDLPTFKRKMQILLTDYKQSPGLRAAPGESKTRVLPKERMEELRSKVQEDQRRVEEINRIQDARNKARQLSHYYDYQAKFTKNLKQEVQNDEKVLGILEKAAELVGGMPQDMSEEERSKYTATLKKIIDDVTEHSPSASEEISEKTENMQPGPEYAEALRKIIQKEKQDLARLIQYVKENESRLSEYEQKAKQYAEQSKQTGPVPSTPMESIPGKPDKPVPYGTTSVQAGQDAYGPQKSPYEIALETKGKTPDYRRDIPRPKGYDVLEGFLTDAKEELRILEGLKMTGKELDEIPEEVTTDISNRISQLERIIPAISQYGDQMVDIDGTKVPLKEIVVKFEDMIDDYQEKTSKAIKQRDDAIERLNKLQQKLRQHEEFIDPETGEYKDLTEAEKENMKKIFLRLLYKDLDKYWSSKVGKNIDVFGERDTAWYDNVFRSFQTLENVRSNRKLMSLLNKYKSETRGDFGDTINRDKIQELEKRKEELENRYAVLGEDPRHSPEIQKLEVLIPQLKKQRDQQDKVFTEMAQAVQAQANIGVQDAVAQAAGEKPETKSDLSSVEKKNIEEAEAALQAIENSGEMPQPEYVEEAEKVLDKAEQDVEEVSDQIEKEAVLRSSPHYNQKILYGSVMQKKIAELLSKEF